MRIHSITLVTLASALALASCQSSNTLSSKPQTQAAPKSVVTAAPNSAINGKWVPTDAAAAQIYYNEFRNGKFITRSPDGKTTIAAGQYKVSDSGDISMNGYSEARKANITATCKQITQSELQCTSNGSVFNLRRA